MAHMTQFSTRPFIIRGGKTCRAHLLVESPACFVNIPFEALEAEAVAAVEFVVVVLAAAVEPAREEAAGSKMTNRLENFRKIKMVLSEISIARISFDENSFCYAVTEDQLVSMRSF